MRRSIQPRLVPLVLAATLLAGCPGGQVATTGPKRPAAPRPAASPGLDQLAGGVTGAGIVSNNGGAVVAIGGANAVVNIGAGLTGKVKMPAGIVANNGAGLISDNGGAIVANNGGGVVANSGGGVVANNGGSLVGPTRFGLAAAPEQKPLAGFAVRLLDAAGEPVRDAQGAPLVAVTDSQGTYAFAGLVPTRNLILEVALPGTLGAVTAVVPREGGERRTVDVDLVSTLTTGYIMSRYVRSQADPLATLEKLPAAVEAETRQRAAAAVVAAGTSPATLAERDVVAAVDALRQRDAALDGQLETVRKLLVVAGASDLGSGMDALDVTLGDIHDLAVTADGTLYVFCQNDKRVWRLRKDGKIETAVGARGVPDGGDLDGQLGTEASLDFPKAIGADSQGRLLVNEARGTFRLEPDGRLRSVGAGKASAMAAGFGDEAIVAVIEPASTPGPGAGEEDAGPPMAVGQAYVFYGCKAGAPPVRLFEQLLDADDWGEQTRFLTGIAWDGGEHVYLGMRNTPEGRWELQRRKLDGSFEVTWTNPADVAFEANGDAIYPDAAGAMKARNVIAGGPERPLPPPVPGFPVSYAIAPDGTAYAAKFGVVYRLEAAGPVRIAGNPTGQPAGGDATSFTFEVLGDVAVAPSGEVYAGDTGRGLVYKVDAAGKLAEFGKIGGGNVQLLRTDPGGVLWMSDGDGDKIGKFDAAGVWTAAHEVGGLINDFAVAADGAVYAVSWDIEGARQRQVFKLANGQKTLLTEAGKGLAVAVDAQGAPWVAGDGKLQKWDGAAFQVVKADARFDFGLAITGLGAAFDAAGRLYVASSGTADQAPPVVFRYDPQADAFKTIAGAGGTHFTGAAGADDGLKSPRTPGFDAQGNLYFADTGNRQVKKIPRDEL